MAKLKKPGYDLFAFFEMTPVLVCIAGKDGFFKKVNPAVIDKLGYTEVELFARPIASFIHPEDRELTDHRRAGMLKGKAMLNFENRYVAKNGRIIWLEWASIYSSDKEIVFAIGNDVTERKQIAKEVEEKYIKFKSLATHFKTSIEKDRKYLATELHEELAQLVAVLKMDVDWIGSSIPDLPGSSKDRFEHALIISDLLINAIRRMAFSISPTMLEDLDLNAALEWQCREFSILNGIPCSFESEYDETGLTHEVKVDFFRICQESLSNVMYHAQASKVKISIEATAGKIVLSIIDDGKGFDIHEPRDTLGLVTMRERAASINGQLAIRSEIGKGTRVAVTIASQ